MKDLKKFELLFMGNFDNTFLVFQCNRLYLKKNN